MKFRAKVHVTLKDSVLDPQGTAVTHALHALHFDTVADVRIGKYMEVLLEAETADAAGELVRKMCEELLANLVIEKYSFELMEVVS